MPAPYMLMSLPSRKQPLSRVVKHQRELRPDDQYEEIFIFDIKRCFNNDNVVCTSSDQTLSKCLLMHVDA